MSDEECQIEMRDGNPCGGHIYKDKTKCIFHLENKSEEEAKIFEIMFWEELDRMEKDKDIKVLDFTGFIFTNEINFNDHLFEKSVYFSHAQFKSADFYDAQFKDGANFLGAQFKDRANFCGAQFNDEACFLDVIFDKVVYFVDAQFNNKAIFFRVQFNDEVYFSRAKFNNDAHFSSHFNNKAYFLGVQFNNKAYFLGVQFNNKVNFSGVQFNDKADFSGAQFNDKADFSGAQFNNVATFESSEFRDAVFFIDSKFSSCDEDVTFLKDIKFHKPKDVRFRNNDLSNVYFLNTDVSEVEFLDVNWRKNGRIIVADEIHIGNDDSATYGAVVQLYQRLRKNYENNYRFAEAGEFFTGEMEMRRMDVNTNIKNEKVKSFILLFKRNISLLNFYKQMSLYGESYVRPVILASIVIISYPILMHWLLNTSLDVQSDDFIYTYLRNSAASFFQMDNTYIGERIIGFLILGLLFIALKRQFERKK